MGEDDVYTKDGRVEPIAEDDDVYTKDGTVDYKGNPANKKVTGTWRACPFILGNECCERLAFYGMSSNLVYYFKYHLKQSSANAAKSNSNWSGTCYLTPLLGAFLADAYLGRYKTIASFSIIYIIAAKSLNAQKFFKKIGCGKEDYHFWKQIGKALLCTYTLGGVAWLYNETSPLGWWTLKPRPKEERELAHLYERREFPYRKKQWKSLWQRVA